MATIDVRKTDEFKACDTGSMLYQLRDDLYRAMLWGGIEMWSRSCQWGAYRTIPHTQALAVIRAMGHTVDEVEAEPEAVRVTHGVGIPGADVFYYVGTKEACERLRLSLGKNFARVVPIVMGGA